MWECELEVVRAANVLVAYATKHGSTREVAESISATLGELGADVELRPARDVRGSIADRDLIVLGAPIYSGRWHRDAHRFLKRHRKDLLTVPVAVFGMGPRSGSEEGWQRSRSQLDRALAKREAAGREHDADGRPGQPRPIRSAGLGQVGLGTCWRAQRKGVRHRAPNSLPFPQARIPQVETALLLLLAGG